jgi:hypothetical protein
LSALQTECADFAIARSIHELIAEDRVASHLSGAPDSEVILTISEAVSQPQPSMRVDLKAQSLVEDLVPPPELSLCQVEELELPPSTPVELGEDYQDTAREADGAIAPLCSGHDSTSSLYGTDTSLVASSLGRQAPACSPCESPRADLQHRQDASDTHPHDSSQGVKLEESSNRVSPEKATPDFENGRPRDSAQALGAQGLGSKASVAYTRAGHLKDEATTADKPPTAPGVQALAPRPRPDAAALPVPDKNLVGVRQVAVSEGATKEEAAANVPARRTQAEPDFPPECEAGMLKLFKRGCTNEQVMRHFTMVDYNLTLAQVQRFRDLSGVGNSSNTWVKGIGRVGNSSNTLKPHDLNLARSGSFKQK